MLLGKTVGTLEQTMSSQELSEWIAYRRIRPLPDSYWQAGLVASTTANCWGASTTPEDFIPRSVQVDDGPDVAKDLAAFSAFASSHNARLDIAS